MKKILLVITKGEIGGAQVSVFNLAKGLKERSLDVFVGFGEASARKTQSYEAPLRKIRFLEEKLETAKIPYYRFRWLKRTRNPFANLAFIFELKKFLDREGFDVVHFNSSNALIGALGAKLSKSKPKTIFTFRGLSILDPNYEASSISKFIYRLIFKFFLRFIDEKVFVSQENLGYAKKINLVKGGEIIYNGLDPRELKFFERDEAQKFLESKIGINLKDRFLIGSIGRLAYPKNYEFLIEVFPEILKISHNAICLIIGDGPEKEKYQKLIKKLGLESAVYLAGEIKDAAQCLKAFDLFVLPSKYEGLSITLIESLFAGLPILATNVGGNPEVLENAGWLYGLDNKEDFLEKVGKIIEDGKIIKELSEKTEAKAGKFTIDKTAEGYLKIYNK